MKLITAVVLLTAFTTTATAEDLIEVTLHSHLDAEILNASPAAPIAALGNRYLVLASRTDLEQIEKTSLDIELIAAGVNPSLLAVDRRPQPAPDRTYRVLYDRHGLRLVSILDRQALVAARIDLTPLRLRPVVVRYVPPRALPPLSAETLHGIDSLAALVSEDSLRSYTERLQAFHRRLTGTDSSRAARDWIAAKFTSFGYDSVVIDPFVGSQLWDRVPVQSYNVVACKRGAVYPDQQIIIGGHFDAVPDCPGADDNATGTAGTLEIARILAAADLPTTLKFIAFDSEESSMWGSYHYADSVAAEDAGIVLMINLDMIAHGTNTSHANLYWGADDVYAQLWASLAPTYGDITASFKGHTASDHQPFIENGYDGLFVQEYFFSTNYHQPSDSTTYLNFEYMTRMVKVSLATAGAVWNLPPPVRIVAIREPGDGQSQLVEWQPVRSPLIDHYRASWYPVGNPGSVQSTIAPAADSSVVATGLIDGVTYAFSVRAYNAQGQSALAAREVLGTPRSRPRLPANLTALPLYHAVALRWHSYNQELDFSHYNIIRDGDSVAATTDTFYEDTDPLLGGNLHRYLVAAVDTDGNLSDTVGALPAESRAATLEPGRILAVNRDNLSVPGADVTLTGEFLRTALNGANFEYRSDSAYGNPASRTCLHELVTYELVVIAAETFNDNIAFDPSFGGLLDTLAYYLSLGGKLLVFGRFGPGNTVPLTLLDYAATGQTWDDSYATTFHTATRSLLPFLVAGQVHYDLVGAHSQQPGYPPLVWDSLRTALHEPALPTPAGICGGSFVSLNSPAPDILYTYDSRSDDTLAENQVVAWRYLGSDYRYIWFDLPLSFFEETAANTALRRAVTDLTGIAPAVDPDPTLPGRFTLAQNYPNPFNPTTTIRYSLPTATPVKLTVYNLLGQTVAVLIDRHQSPGLHEITWTGTDRTGKTVATGLYLYRLQTATHTATRKMLLIK